MREFNELNISESEKKALLDSEINSKDEKSGNVEKQETVIDISSNKTSILFRNSINYIWNFRNLQVSCQIYSTGSRLCVEKLC